MNSHTAGDDRDIEQVERAYRELGAEQPPELLDRAVLNRARRAVGKRRPWTWNLGWYHTVGTAASVLLAVGVFLQMRNEVPKTPMPANELRDAVRSESEFDRASQVLSEAEPADESSAQRADRQAETDALALPASRKETPTTVPREEQVQAKRALAKDQPDRETPRASARASAAPVTGEAGPEKRQAEPSADADSRFEAMGEERVQRLRQVDDAAADLPEPEAWLAELRRLRESGDEAAFRERLEAFRAAYPDYPLPEDWPD